MNIDQARLTAEAREENLRDFYEISSEEHLANLRYENSMEIMTSKEMIAFEDDIFVSGVSNDGSYADVILSRGGAHYPQEIVEEWHRNAELLNINADFVRIWLDSEEVFIYKTEETEHTKTLYITTDTE